MSDLVARAEAVLEGVTAGPWVVNRDGWACVSSGSDSVFHGYFEGTCGDCGDEILDAAKVAIGIEDAEFIAAARTLVPELVAELKAARAELVELGSIFDALVEKSRQTHGELKAARASEERHLHEIFHLQDDLKAARAEAEREHGLFTQEAAATNRRLTADEARALGAAVLAAVDAAEGETK